MSEQYANSASSTLSGGINNSATTLAVANGSAFPSSGDFRIMVALVDPVTGAVSNSELMLVSARSTDTLSSITRGVEGTSAVSHASGESVIHILTAAAYKAGIDERIATHAAAAAPHSSLVVKSIMPVNAKDVTYGATGDGTTDDTTALAAAITATPAGGTLYIPGGTYITNQLTLDKRIRIVGDGKNATVLKAKSGASGPLLNWNNSTLRPGCSLRGLGLDMTNATGIAAVYMHNVRNGVVDDLYISPGGTVAFQLDLAQGMTVSNVDVFNASAAAFKGTHASSSGNRFIACFTDNTTVTGVYGFLFDGGLDWWCIGCQAFRAPGAAIDLQYGFAWNYTSNNYNATGKLLGCSADAISDRTTDSATVAALYFRNVGNCSVVDTFCGGYTLADLTSNPSVKLDNTRNMRFSTNRFGGTGVHFVGTASDTSSFVGNQFLFANSAGVARFVLDTAPTHVTELGSHFDYGSDIVPVSDDLAAWSTATVGRGARAEVVSFTPGGTIAATDTQAAVAEVATDAAADLSTHAASSHVALGSTPSTQAFGDAAAGGSDATASKNDHKHGMPSERAAASTTPAAVGTAAVGTGTTDARSDHVHATGAGTPSTQAMGDAAATGSGPAAAMTDHKHAMPALGTSAAAVGTSAGGSATTPSKSDHVHATGAGTPSTQAHGDSATTGSGPAASMTDHKHALGNLSGDVTTSGSNATTLAAGSASNLNSGTLPAGRLPALTGDVTSSAGSAATTLAAGSASNLNSGTLPAGRLPALTGDVTSSAGSAATTLAAGSATNLNSGTLAAARLPAHTGDATSSAGSAALTVVQASGTWTLPGVISPSQLTANTDDWAPTGLSTASRIRVSTDASRNLTGITGGAVGRVLYLHNVGAQNLVLKHDATSTAANRFYCPGDTDFTIAKDSSCHLIYDATSSRWRVIHQAAAAGGSGAVATDAIWTANGQLAVGTGSTTAAALNVGTPGQVLVAGAGSTASDPGYASPLHLGAYAPTGVTIESWPRHLLSASTIAAVSSGVLRMQAIALPKNFTVTTIYFCSGTVALSGGTNGWFALFDASRNLLRQSTNDTGVTWGGHELKGYNLSSTYTTTASGLFYVGYMVTFSSTGPNMSGFLGVNNGAANQAPFLTGTSSTGLTTTAPNPAAAISLVANSIWCGVS